MKLFNPAEPPRRSLRPWLFWGAITIVILVGLYYGGVWYNRAMHQRDTDHLFDNILAGGNPTAAHREADSIFQQMVPVEAIVQLLEARPALRQREQLSVTSVEWQRGSDGVYAVIQAQLDDGLSPAALTFYCRQDARGNWRLVGIAPNLMTLVPRKLEPVTGNPHRNLK